MESHIGSCSPASSRKHLCWVPLASLKVARGFVDIKRGYLTFEDACFQQVLHFPSPRMTSIPFS